MKIQHFFDSRTSTLTYVVHDETTQAGVVIDPMLDCDPESSRIWHESCEQIGAYIESLNLLIPYGYCW